MSVAAIVVAGGSGSRFGGTGNKAYAALGGWPLASHSLASLAAAGCDPLVLVIRPGDGPQATEAIGRAGVDAIIVPGGPTRHASEHRGLEALRSAVVAGTVEVVLVHDAARPLATVELVTRVVEAAHHRGGACPGLPLSGPVFTRGPAGLRPAQVDRLWRVQTPQGFHARPLLEAYDRAAIEGFEGVDTAETAHRFGDIEVEVVPGDPDNLKVTLPGDLSRAERILTRRQVRGRR